MTKPTNEYLLDDLWTFDVFKVYLLDEATNIELYADSLTDTSLNFKEDVKDIKAGVGNKLLMTIPTSKEISLELTDVRTRLDWLAAKQGTSVAKGAAVAWHLPRPYTVKANTITLSAEPIKTADVRFMKIDSVTGAATEISGTISTKVVTFTGVEDGTSIYVTGYAYNSAAGTLKVDFDAEKFAKTFKVVMEGIVYNGARKPVFTKQYIFHRAALEGNIEEATKSERDASQTKSTLKVQQVVGQSELGYVLFIPYSA